MKRLLSFLLLITQFYAFGQTSHFDTNDEKWMASGDPTSAVPAWYAMGGNPDGHIRVADASTGGTWYFVAPPEFAGQKCDAYGKYLRYDQLTSDTADQQQYGGQPDVILAGGGLQLIFDNAVNPGLDWTHYDILLAENAGWRIGNLNGPSPTPEQFKAVLANVSDLRIRGEYRAQADEGGLDNVVLESNFHFDLDGDDSSGASGSNFMADTSCTVSAVLADTDALLQSETRIDSIVIYVIFPTLTDELHLDVLIGNMIIEHPSPSRFVLVSDGTTSAADFLLGLQLLTYFDAAARPVRGRRQVEMRVYSSCGLAGIATAFLPLFPKPNAGQDVDALLCANSDPLDLLPVLGSLADPGGYWQPTLNAGLFDPQRTTPGIYQYLLPPAGVCPGDTAMVTVTIDPAFQLREDTTVCYGDSLHLRVPQNVVSWRWSTGSEQRELPIDAPGTYSLEGQTANCTFSDSVNVRFYTCVACPFYAPNIFSPNDDGENDTWFTQLACVAQDYHLQVFDRWGDLVFEANDPQMAWDGRYRGKEAGSGVYLWQLEWAGELLGERQVFRQKGDVTLLR